ncbi:MAG: hypothetical protein ABI253_06630 [Mycobacterium sp.]
MTARMAVLAAVGFGLITIAGAPIAAADDFAGQYAFREGVGPTAGDFSSVWTVTPCGDDCRHIVTSTGATDTEAHLDGPYWVFDKYVDPGVECPGTSYTIVKRKVPATMRFTISSDTLIGQFQPVGTPCGGIAPPTGFSLAKTLG